MVAIRTELPQHMQHNAMLNVGVGKGIDDSKGTDTIENLLNIDLQDK